jgi:hypothetical protein
LQGCRTKTAGSCDPIEGSLASSRLYYAIVTPTGMRVITTTYFSAQDTFPFPTTNYTQQWNFSGSINCLASASYSLSHFTGGDSLGDGCGWGTGTLSPG